MVVLAVEIISRCLKDKQIPGVVRHSFSTGVHQIRRAKNRPYRLRNMGKLSVLVWRYRHAFIFSLAQISIVPELKLPRCLVLVIDVGGGLELGV